MATVRFRKLPAMVPGKLDVFMADPRKITVDAEYNCRDMNSAETLAHVDWLADEIEAQGFNPEMPLTVKRRADEIIVIRGHCRLAACLKLIERGVELVGVPVMQIAAGTSDVDLIFDQEASNNGLRLDTLAKARICLKARRLQVPDEEIARRMHWKDVTSVRRHIEMIEVLPEPVKQQVREGDISATEATKLVKNLPAGTDPKIAAELIAANKEENKRLGVGKRTNHKVTAKTLKRDAPKRNPEVDSNAPANPQVQLAPAAAHPLPAIQEHRGPEDSVAEDRLGIDVQPTADRGLSMDEVNAEIARITHETNGSTSAPQVPDGGTGVSNPTPVTVYPPPPRSYDINNAFFAVVVRLATIGEDLDLNALADDHVIEVPAEVIKAADRAYREHIGDA